MDDYTDDFDDDYCDDGDYADDDFEDPLEVDEDDLDDDFCDEDGVVSDAEGDKDDFDLGLQDATPIGGINLKKAVIFGIAMEWEDAEKTEDPRRKKKPNKKE